MQALEKTKSYLKRTDKHGTSLYDHLTKIIQHVVNNQIEDPVNVLETISTSIKEKEFRDNNIKETVQNIEIDEVRIQNIDKIKELVVSQATPQDEEGEEVKTVLPDILLENSLFKNIGVGLDDTEAYLLQCSISKFCIGKNLNTANFFGKIFGTEKDYYVLEVEPESYPETEKVEPTQEDWGTGLNKYVYYVANSLEGSWTELPPVLPEQVTISKNKIQICTGNVNASVLGYPRFKWKEISYVRAIISRIKNACSICPNGYYAKPEDDDDESSQYVVKSEEYEQKSYTDLLSKENWCHYTPCILKKGRTTKFAKPEEEDEDGEDKENDENEEEEEEVVPEILRTLDQDEGENIWKLRCYPLNSLTKDTNAESKLRLQHATLCVESLAWPGAYTISKGNDVFQVYIGYGTKSTSVPFTPLPEPIQQEYKVEVAIEQVDPSEEKKQAEAQEENFDEEQ